MSQPDPWVSPDSSTFRRHGMPRPTRHFALLTAAHKTLRARIKEAA